MSASAVFDAPINRDLNEMEALLAKVTAPYTPSPDSSLPIPAILVVFARYSNFRIDHAQGICSQK